MAMNKKEKAQLDEALTMLSLRRTEPVYPDIPKPKSDEGIVDGWLPQMGRKVAIQTCSSSYNHSRHGWGATCSQNAIEQFSSELLALQALRYGMEVEFAKELRKVDLLIEEVKNDE